MARPPAIERRPGLLPAAVLLFVIAGLCLVRSVLPEELVVDAWDPGGAQFLAFYLTLLGVGLVQSSDNARRFVWFASVPTLLLAIALIATGVGLDRLFGVALGALAAGLILMLFGPHASAGRVGVGLVLAATGAAAVFPMEITLARSAREEERRRLTEWRAADQTLTRPDLGVRFIDLEGWVVLRPGSPYVPPDATAVVAMVHERSGARAVLKVDPDLRASDTPDAAVERLVSAWRSREPGLELEHERAKGQESGEEQEAGQDADQEADQEQEAEAPRVVALGEVAGRRVDVSWERDKVAHNGLALAWLDASRALALVAWYETRNAGAAAAEVERMVASLAVTRPLLARIAAAAETAAPQMPQLTRRTIELVVARRPDADTATLFREGLAAASVGFQRLDPAHVRDMGEINRALYARMPAADSAWMEDYVRRVRAAQRTSADEDARAMRAMAAAVERLPEDSQARLRVILENAVSSAYGG